MNVNNDGNLNNNNVNNDNIGVRPASLFSEIVILGKLTQCKEQRNHVPLPMEMSEEYTSMGKIYV